MREQPDRLAEYVLSLLETACTSTLSREEVRAELLYGLRRDVSYLLRRKRLGRQTAYDEVLEETLKVRARAIVLLASSAEAKDEAPRRGSGMGAARDDPCLTNQADLLLSEGDE